MSVLQRYSNPVRHLYRIYPLFGVWMSGPVSYKDTAEGQIKTEDRQGDVRECMEHQKRKLNRMSNG